MLAAVALAIAASAAFTSSAGAQIAHSWNCSGGEGLTPNNQCYDTTGTSVYQPWVLVGAAINTGNGGISYYTGLCVKAADSSGYTKSGSSCHTSSYTTFSIAIAASPSSRGYYYWGGTGASISNSGNAHSN